MYNDYKDLKSWEDAVKSITEVIGDEKEYIMKVSLARDNCYKDWDVIFGISSKLGQV